MSNETVTLRVGEPIWFDGATWTVAEIFGASARLHRAHETRLADIVELLSNARCAAEVAATAVAEEELQNVALANLTRGQQERLRAAMEALRPLLDPPFGSVASLHQAAAETLGVSTRTLRRMLQKYEAHGPAGLLDRRILQSTRRAVDPRWDAACIEVLGGFALDSTPTKQTVIRRTNKLLSTTAPDVPLPSDSTAYTRCGILPSWSYSHLLARGTHGVRVDGVWGCIRAGEECAPAGRMSGGSSPTALRHGCFLSRGRGREGSAEHLGYLREYLGRVRGGVREELVEAGGLQAQARQGRLTKTHDEPTSGQ